MHAHVYRAPEKLRKRVDTDTVQDFKTVQANTEAMGVELHKDSKFYESWQNFKDNNPYVNKVLDWKIKYDESDNPVIRATRLFTDKVSDVMGGLFQKTELSETLTEICKLDPNFDKVQFLRECESDIIPNILESMIRGDLEILKSWCHDGPYNLLSTPIKQAQQLGYRFSSKVLDIDNVDITMGKVMDQGPILVITFTSQQILCVKDAKGTVVEGDPEKVLRVNYVWVLCRDKTELNPKAAWRLLDLSAQSTEQLV
uniref:Mitochondrial import inner membrane translocase subunit TIM44 n=2 Tax=Homalodisca liturata TaxID=320908 RepID=A0A1B6I0C0_9HEMI